MLSDLFVRTRGECERRIPDQKGEVMARTFDFMVMSDHYTEEDLVLLMRLSEEIADMIAITSIRLERSNGTIASWLESIEKDMCHLNTASSNALCQQAREIRLGWR